MIGIYKITNLVNGKLYIGQSWDIEKRWNRHVKYQTSKHLNAAIIKYGIENFSFEVIYETTLEESLDEEMVQLKLNIMEMGYIDHYQSSDPIFGYNKTHGGGGGVPTEEIRKKISQANKGKIRSDEAKMKVSKANKGRKHGPRSEEYKKKLSNALKGKKRSEEHQRKINEANRGKKHTEETRKRMSDSHKNMSEETRRKMQEAQIGKKQTEEHKRKALLNRYKSKLYKYLSN